MKYEDIKAGETYNVRVKVIGIAKDGVDAIYVDADGIAGLHIGKRRVCILRPLSPENGTKNTEPAPKYDPCRKFLKGDKVRIREWHGRKPEDNTKNKIWEVMYDEGDYVDIKHDSYGHHEKRIISTCFLELITPVEELEPFYVCENTESKSFEVRRKEDHKVQAAFYYFDKDDTHAKSEAAKATLEHCDRLNAKNRKEQQ